MSPRRADPEADKRGMRSWFFVDRNGLDFDKTGSDHLGAMAMIAIRIIDDSSKKTVTIDDIITNTIGVGIVGYENVNGEMIGTWRVEYLGETYEKKVKIGESESERAMSSDGTTAWKLYKAEQLAIEP